MNITSNGTYEASSGHAYDVVTVNVQPILDVLVDTVNENGTYVYEPDEGYDGLEEVRVTVSVPEPVFEHLTRTITSNGTYNYTPSSGKDGFDEANITVNVPTPQPSLQTKQVSVTQNGSSVITADSGYDGLDEVDLTVNVPSSQPTLEQASVLYVNNGNYTVTPSQGYDGLESVDVEVDVPSSQPILQTKSLTITQNGTSVVTPDSGYDGLDEVDITVNVSGGGGLPSNISIDEYTPTDNELGFDHVVLSHDTNHYLIGCYIVDISGDSNAVPGEIKLVSILKRYVYTAPQSGNADSLSGIISYSARPNATGMITASTTANTQVFLTNPTYNSTPSMPATITGANQITILKKPSTNQTPSYRGAIYGKHYLIIGIYSG